MIHLYFLVGRFAVCYASLDIFQFGTYAQDEHDLYSYEDRTMRFFPPSPRIPRMHGLGSGDSGLMDDSDDSFQELSNYSYQHFNVLCSGDKDGCICFSAFGIFQMGKIVSEQLKL